jgi:hypothetical protein
MNDKQKAMFQFSEELSAAKKRIEKFIELLNVHSAGLDVNMKADAIKIVMQQLDIVAVCAHNIAVLRYGNDYKNIKAYQESLLKQNLESADKTKEDMSKMLNILTTFNTQSSSN